MRQSIIGRCYRHQATNVEVRIHADAETILVGRTQAQDELLALEAQGIRLDRQHGAARRPTTTVPVDALGLVITRTELDTDYIPLERDHVAGRHACAPVPTRCRFCAFDQVERDVANPHVVAELRREAVGA